MDSEQPQLGSVEFLASSGHVVWKCGICAITGVIDASILNPITMYPKAWDALKEHRNVYHRRIDYPDDV
jgi:hypothetical protein